MIRVRHIGSDHPEDYAKGQSFMETNGCLVVFSDTAASKPIIAYGSGVWLTAEVING